jgi:pimeloyl-ACP methyl ester carboxylesterase
MKRSKLLYATVRAAIVLSIGAIWCTHVNAQFFDSSKAPVKNILLVHGAWADGSSWSKVIPRLTSRGFHVVAVQIPLTSLADDVAATARAIALENGPVLLVAHSYGGAVTTEAGNDPKVVGLVYVAAFAPDEGESSLSLANAYPTPVASELRPDADNAFYKLSDKGIIEDFAQDLSILERKVLLATQIPTAGEALGAPATNPAWRNKLTWFVISAHDRVVSPQLEEMEAVRMNAETITLSTSHVAMLADPEHVAEFIERAAMSCHKK